MMYRLRFHSVIAPSKSGEDIRITDVDVYDEEDNYLGHSYAVQNPNDQDIKVLGQKYAVHNFCRNHIPNKEDRDMIWDSFFSSSKKAFDLIHKASEWKRHEEI